MSCLYCSSGLTDYEKNFLCERSDVIQEIIKGRFITHEKTDDHIVAECRACKTRWDIVITRTYNTDSFNDSDEMKEMDLEQELDMFTITAKAMVEKE